MSAKAEFYQLRVNQPGYGPKIIVCVLSDLDPIGESTQSDLYQQPCYFTGSGSPSVDNLLNGNYSAENAITGYLQGDTYYDTAGNGFYICTQAGSPSSSQWQQLTGGGGFAGNYNPNVSYQKAVFVRVANTIVVNGVTVLAGFYACAQNTGSISQNGAQGNQIPQFPEPLANVYWYFMAPITIPMNQGCGGNAASYAAATNTEPLP